MNILLVSKEFPPSPHSAGIGSYTYDLARGLSELGHIVVVLTAKIKNRKISSIYKSEKFIIEEININDFFIGRSYFAKILNRIYNFLFYERYRQVLANKISELHVNYNFDICEIPEFGNEGKYWLPNKSFPTIIRFHGPSSLNFFERKIFVKNKKQKDEINILQYADSYSFVSSLVKNIILEELKFNKKIPSFVIHNNVQIDNSMTHIYNEINNSFSIVGVGSLGRLKGWDLLVNTCERLNEQGYNITLDLYGRHADLEEFLTTKAKSHKWLKIHGYVNRNTLFSIYSKADLCCFPSLYDSMSLTVLEAMANQGLVLTSIFNGASELITNEKNAFLMNPSEGINGLENILKKIINTEPKKKLQIRIQGQHTVTIEYSFNEYLKQTLKMYNKTIINVKELYAFSNQ